MKSALMTIRSEGQFNTVVYEDYDLYRGIDRRDVILLHPDDIRTPRLDVGEDASPSTARPARCTASASPSSTTSAPATRRCTTPRANMLVSRQRRPREQDAGVQMRRLPGEEGLISAPHFAGVAILSNRIRGALSDGKNVTFLLT